DCTHASTHGDLCLHGGSAQLAVPSTRLGRSGRNLFQTWPCTTKAGTPSNTADQRSAKRLASTLCHALAGTVHSCLSMRTNSRPVGGTEDNEGSQSQVGAAGGKDTDPEATMVCPFVLSASGTKSDGQRLLPCRIAMHKGSGRRADISAAGGRGGGAES